MSDELDTLSDAELSAIFAVEIAGWTRDTNMVWPWSFPDGSVAVYDPEFSTNANGVLEWLPKHWRCEAGIIYDPPKNTPRNLVIVKVKDGDGRAATFARAAAIALIRAKRASKEAAL